MCKVTATSNLGGCTVMENNGFGGARWCSYTISIRTIQYKQHQPHKEYRQHITIQHAICEHAQQIMNSHNHGQRITNSHNHGQRIINSCNHGNGEYSRLSKTPKKRFHSLGWYQKRKQEKACLSG